MALISVVFRLSPPDKVDKPSSLCQAPRGPSLQYSEGKQHQPIPTPLPPPVVTYPLPPSLWSAPSTQTWGKHIKIFQQHRERILLSFITIAIGPKRDKCLLSISLQLELQKFVLHMCVCVCVREMEAILCCRADPLRGCLAGWEQVCWASGFHHVFQLFHLHLFPQVLDMIIKTLINHKMLPLMCRAAAASIRTVSSWNYLLIQQIYGVRCHFQWPLCLSLKTFISNFPDGVYEIKRASASFCFVHTKCKISPLLLGFLFYCLTTNWIRCFIWSE